MKVKKATSYSLIFKETKHIDELKVVNSFKICIIIKIYLLEHASPKVVPPQLL